MWAIYYSKCVRVFWLADKAFQNGGGRKKALLMTVRVVQAPWVFGVGGGGDMEASDSALVSISPCL